MIIGILQCDDVKADLQVDHGNYQQMFSVLLRDLLPESQLPVYRVLDGEFPDNANECDAYLITGSKHGVNDGMTWIDDLCEFVRELWTLRTPLIGVCFGHQLMARALGGTVRKAEQGWGLGLSFNQLHERREWMAPYKDHLDLLVSHQDQVTILPPQAQVLASSEFCPYYLVQYAEHFVSVQGHPEFTKGYSRDLLKMREEILPPARVRAALTSLHGKTDGDLMMQWLVQFLQTARQLS